MDELDCAIKRETIMDELAQIEHWASQVRLQCAICDEWKPYPDLADFHAPSEDLDFQAFICNDCLADS